MSMEIISAIAVPFAWTSSAPDLALAFPSGTSPVNVTLPSGTYYVCLSASTADVVRVLESAINAAVTGAGRSEVFTLTVGADSRITITSTGVFSATLSTLLKLLGFSSAISSALAVTAAYPPAYLATFVERVSSDWSPRTALAGAETLAGLGCGVLSGVSREEDEITFGFIPRDPSTRASLALTHTPWMPDSGTAVGALMPRVWTCRDLLSTALGKTLHVVLGSFQTARADTGARFDLCTLPAVEIATPRKARQRDGWDAYFRWTVRVIRQSAQTEART